TRQRRCKISRHHLHLVALAREFLSLLLELEEYLSLESQDERIDRLRDIVYGASLVAAKTTVLVDRGGCQKYDRYFQRTLRPAHEFGKLIAVHVRHMNVEKREGIFVL